jgi:hypothetical protein
VKKNLDFFLLPPTPYENPNEILVSMRFSLRFSYRNGGERKKTKKFHPPRPYENPNEILVSMRISFGFSYGVGGRRKQSNFFHPPPPYENPNEILMYDYAITDRSW